MRRLFAILSIASLVAVVAACSQVFQGVQAVVNAPGNVVTAVRGPGDTIGFPIRYETRPTASQELFLQADGTFTIRSTKDSTVTDSGHYTVIFGQFSTGSCQMSLGAVWLKGACFGKNQMWREAPQNLRWPPTQPKTPVQVKQTAYLPSDPTRSFGIVTVPA